MKNENNIKTILTEENLRKIIAMEKRLLMQDGSLSPRLLVVNGLGERTMIGLPELPSNSDVKAMMLRAIGLKLRTEHGGIREALFIAESWMTTAKAPDANKIPPSRHPAREEIILIVGRNDDKSQTAFAIQPFSRDGKGQPIWKEPTIALSEEQGGLTFDGILDDLFIGATQLDLPDLEA